MVSVLDLASRLARAVRNRASTFEIALQHSNVPQKVRTFFRTFHPVIFDRMKSNSKVIHFSIEKSIEKCTERYIEKCTEKYIEKSRFIGEVYWVYQVRMGRVLSMLKSFTRAKSLGVEHVKELCTR